ncbi:MAG: hypothetical protein AB1714_25575 [Acidobacteriota bacterium]
MVSLRVLIAILSLSAPALLTASDYSEPAFLITGIEISGTHWVSKDLVRTETRLDLGRAYSERDLILALRRVSRLPFVLSADFSLAKGLTYGTYTLVIEVRETYPLFVQYEKTVVKTSPTEDARALGYGPAPEVTGTGQNIALGGRFSVGAYGLGYLVVSREAAPDAQERLPATGLNVGFSHYRLTRKNIFLNVNLQVTARRTGERMDDLVWSSGTITIDRPVSPSLTVSMPVLKNHWISFDASYLRERQAYDFASSDLPFQDRMTDSRLQMNLSWYYDTTDDLLLPRRGVRWEAGLSYIRQRSEYQTRFFATDDVPFETELSSQLSEVTQLYATAVKNWPISRRLSVHAGGLATYRLHEGGTYALDSQYRKLELQGGGSWDVWGRRMTERVGDLRLELLARYRNADARWYGSNAETIEAGLVFRSQWGLFSFSYRRTWEASSVVYGGS